MDFETSKGVKIITKFDQMGLKEGLIRGIYAFGEPLTHPITPAAVISFVLQPLTPPAPPPRGRAAMTCLFLTRPPRTQDLRSRLPSSSAPSCPSSGAAT